MPQIYAEFGHEIRIYTGEFPDWISPSSNAEEPTVSLELLPNKSQNLLGMHESDTDAEEFLDCNRESCYLEESIVSLDLLPNVSHDLLGMHETNTDTEEFLDCVSEPCFPEESIVSSDMLPNVSHNFLGMNGTSTDTEELSDGNSDSSESCDSEESMVLSYDLLSHDIRGLHETSTYTEEFLDWNSESSHLQANTYSDLLPNVSHNFLGMILFFVPFQTYTLTYNIKNTTSDSIWESDSFDGCPELVMVIVPRSIFTVSDGDGIRLTSENANIYGIHLLYKPDHL